jgi:hypothetical protein
VEVRYLLLLAVCAAAGAADRDIGANIGYGFYRNGTIYGAGVTAEGGIINRFAAGIDITDDFSNYVAAQFAYLYHDGHPFLKAPGVKTDIQGQSDALTLGLLFHLNPRNSRFRPFLAGGAGAKGYIIAGPEPFPQPAADIATLRANDVWKVAFSIGGGLRFRLHPRVMLRAEFRDYLTTFPRQQIVPAPHLTARGIFQQFTPLFGVAYVF